MASTVRGVGVFVFSSLLLFAAFPARPQAQAPQACFKADTGSASGGSSMARAAWSPVVPQAAFVETRWNSTAYDSSTGTDGDPITVTWGVVDDGVQIAAAFGPEEVDSASELQATLDAIYGDRATWMALFQQVFDSWDVSSGIRFIHESEDDGVELPGVPSFKGSIGVRPDIRISGHPIDGNSMIVAYAYPPSIGDIVIDTADSFFGNLSQGSLHLRNALAHEVGHAMGLGHVCPESQEKLMEPTVGSFFDGPQADDVLGMAENYGDTIESNDGSSSATDFEFGIGEGAALLDLSIDAPGDEDWIVVPDEPGIRVSITVDPLDAPYDFDSADTLDGGACDGSSEIRIETATAQDLAIQLVAADGTSEIVFRDNGAAGDSEVVTGYPVPGGGFIRVVGDGASELQIYDLVVQFVPEPGSSAAAAAALLALAGLRASARKS